VRVQGLMLLCLAVGLEAGACENGVDQSASPYVKLDGELTDAACTFLYLYTPRMNGSDAIRTISLTIGNEPVSVIPIEFGPAEILDAEFRAPDHVVSQLCLTADLINRIKVSATYIPVPGEEGGKAALCFSSREFRLEEVDGSWYQV
jgi:hypothetical protein